jgi:diguanylate cyclase (GGDEF)-like protein
VSAIMKDNTLKKYLAKYNIIGVLLGSIIYTLLLGGVSLINYTGLVGEQMGLHTQLKNEQTNNIEEFVLAMEEIKTISKVTYSLIENHTSIGDFGKAQEGLYKQSYIVSFEDKKYIISVASNLVSSLLEKLIIVIVFSILGTYGVLQLLNKATVEALNMQLNQLTNAVSNLASKGPKKGSRNSDVKELSDIQSMIGDIGSQFSTEREELREQAEIDHLTQICNRFGFDKKISLLENNAFSNGQGVGLIYIDLDNFKPLNDTYGHDFGDAVLKEFAKILKQNIRGNDTAVRLGGDEFAIVVENINESNGVDTLRDILRSRINKATVIEGISINLSASIGTATFPYEVSKVSDLVAKADKSMYLDKNKYKSKELLAKAKLVSVG